MSSKKKEKKMLRGLDLSKWNSVGTGDGDYDFIICKATEGNGYTDPNCDAHYQRAKSQGKLLGVYHFARPDLGNTGQAEAEWFVSQIQGYIGEAVLVLDFEVQTWKVDWAKAFLDRVYALTGVKPMIYTSGSVVTSNNWSSVVAGDYGLWIAYWPNKYQYSWDWPTSPSEMTYGIGAWPFWAIWQFSSRNGQLDCDVANLDRDAWMKYAAKNGQPAPAPTPTPTPTPTPEPSGDFKVGDKVLPIKYVDYNGTPLIKTRDYYVISQLNGDRAVLTSGGVVYAAVNTNNLQKVDGSTPAPAPSGNFKVGDIVVPTKLVDYNGKPLVQYDPNYTISEIKGDRAVLTARGAVWAAMNTKNIRKV
jgi:GH25 family lysozyme M1 (1,4-beta-N-acetylmuramidase)